MKKNMGMADRVIRTLLAVVVGVTIGGAVVLLALLALIGG